jgi:dUTP pyrophosphatase
MKNEPSAPSTVRIKRADENVSYPKYKSTSAAAADVYSQETKTLASLERHTFSTGLSFQIPHGHELQVRPRSGLAANHGISVLNAPGTLDADYRGELKIILINLSKESYTITKGDRIAQILLSSYVHMTFEEVDELEETERGEGGFGSTGYA